MSRYIDFEIAREYLHKACESLGGNGGMILKIKFDEEPKADVVEVVRCKDCRFSEPVKESDGSFYTCVTGLGVGANHFCSVGERREDAEIH